MTHVCGSGELVAALADSATNALPDRTVQSAAAVAWATPGRFSGTHLVHKRARIAKSRLAAKIEKIELRPDPIIRQDTALRWSRPAPALAASTEDGNVTCLAGGTE